MRWLAALLVTLLGAASAEARVVSESDSAGGMTAEFSYDRTGDEFNQTYRDLTLRIYEGDELVFRDEVACGRRCSPARASGNVVLRDLDGGDPEVVIDLYTGGAYCCWKTVVYRVTANSYVSSAKSWGPKRRQLTNLGGGAPEFISHDDSFLKPYGCAGC